MKLLSLAFFLLAFFSPQKVSAAGDPTTTKFGITYILYHCPEARETYHPIYNIAQALAGKQAWGPTPEMHYWDKPLLGYYCLTDSESVIRQHAQWLTDMGVDFIVADASNHPYTDQSTSPKASTSDRPLVRIQEPFTKLVQVWSTIPNAPKIASHVPLPSDGDMVNFMTGVLDQYPQMYFQYQGKPLLLIADDQTRYATDDTRIAQLESQFTVRKLWGFDYASEKKWSFIMSCQTGFRESQAGIDCNQRMATLNGVPEEISINPAYQYNFISDKTTAVPKFFGKTLQKEIKTLRNNPGIPIAIISSWNDWVSQRFCLGPTGITFGAGCNQPGVTDQFADGSKIFVDDYDFEYNRDLEPSDNQFTDYYMQLTKSCIQLYKQSQTCSASPGNLCCQQFNPADINHDGKSDSTDQTLFLQNYGKSGIPRFSVADISPNGSVDIYDFNQFAKNYDVTTLSETTTTLSGDLNNDGKIDINDLNILISSFGKPNPLADLNKNGTVDIFDYNALIISFSGSVATPPLIGDLNSDGRVDTNDLNILVGSYGQSNSAADFNQNGSVDIYDYNILAKNFS